MVEETTTRQVSPVASNDANIPDPVTAATAVTVSANKRKRIEESGEHESNTKKESATSKTQTDIRNILQMLDGYSNGSNTSNFLEFESIPQLLFGVVGTHFESDLGAMTLAIQAILKHCGTGSQIANKTTCLRNNVIRQLFQKALRSGGTEHALQAIQQLGMRYWKTTKQGINNAKNRMQKSTILGCWKIVMAGIRVGLSAHMYMLVVQACLADLDEVRGMEESALTEHFEILSSVVGALTESLARPELTKNHLVRERGALLTNCLALLSKACLCGVPPSEKASKSNDNNDLEDDGNAISLIEDGLGILVLCAQKGVLVKSDFEGLVPACKACLSRYILSSKNDAAHDITRGIPIRVVQLIEAEDATIGVWLRETHGIPSRAVIGKANGLQNSLLGLYQMGKAPRGTYSQQWMQETATSQAYTNTIRMTAPTNPSGPLRPPPAAPSAQAQHVPTFPSFLICDPDDTDSDEEQYFDHEEDDEE